MSSLLSVAGGIIGSLDDIKEIPVNEVSERIQVCVRIKPITDNKKRDSYAWDWGEKTLHPQRFSQLRYTYDHVFTPDSTNSAIFDSVVKNVVLQCINGYDGSVFTYGLTNSGKTFTMNGSQSQPGMIPLSIMHCFKSVRENFSDRDFQFRISYVEVYNEHVRDLLGTVPTKIRIQHDPKQGIKLIGVKEAAVLTAEEAIAQLKTGEERRRANSTVMNDNSSRAHALFRLIIESKLRGDADSPTRFSLLNLVDLAGSDNAKITYNTVDRAREAKFINTSHQALSFVVQRLSEEKAGTVKKQYLPYRDSKLTRLLQTSLSGNARIAIICTISPDQQYFEETNDTLKFATQVKKVKTSVTITEASSRNISTEGSCNETDDDLDENDIDYEADMNQSINGPERSVYASQSSSRRTSLRNIPENGGSGRDLCRFGRKVTVSSRLSSIVTAIRRADLKMSDSATISWSKIRRKCRGDERGEGIPDPSEDRTGAARQSSLSLEYASRKAESWDSDNMSQSVKLMSSDMTDIDNFFDLISNEQKPSETKTFPCIAGTSWSHVLYRKHSAQTVDNAGDSNEVDSRFVPELAAENIKSYSSIGNNYLKAINNALRPSSVVPTPPTPSFTRGCNVPLPHTQLTVSPRIKSTQKDAFAPGPSLFTALSNITKMTPSSNTAYSDSMPDDSSVAASASVTTTKNETLAAPENDCMTDADPEEGHPSSTHSRLLTVLMKQVEKLRASRKNPEHLRPSGPTPTPTATANHTLLDALTDGDTLRSHISYSCCDNGPSSPLSISTTSGSSSSWVCHRDIPLLPRSRFEEELYHRVDKKDDQLFILEELDRKDAIIASLTRRLMEAEVTKQSWMTQVDKLTNDLEQALTQSQDLSSKDLMEKKAAGLTKIIGLVFECAQFIGSIVVTVHGRGRELKIER